MSVIEDMHRVTSNIHYTYYMYRNMMMDNDCYLRTLLNYKFCTFATF